MVTDHKINELKAHYTAFRQKQFPQFRLDENKWPYQFWVDVATIIDRVGTTPKEYVKSVFDKYGNGSSAPPPNFLKAKPLVELWESGAFKSAEREEARQSIKLMVSLFNSYIASGRSAEATIKDHTLYLNDLMRYVCAYNNQLYELANVYLVGATNFVNTFPIYLELLGKLLPDEFKRGINV